uniref:Zona pellucida sperm-binding protein 3 n=1 Tax=Chelydra serpentina TaxID=8475 RepID=A0A8C3SQQ4_CHESE
MIFECLELAKLELIFIIQIRDFAPLNPCNLPGTSQRLEGTARWLKSHGVYRWPSGEAVSLLHPVKVQCEEAQMVITVSTNLSLGPAACWYTSLNAAENMVTFAAGLHECSSTLQTPDSLVYSTNLSYNPTPASHPVILRTSPAVIPIECHYHRKDNVSSKAIKLTWVPLSSTLSLEERLSFSLMNDDWSTERPFNGFQLGEVMHIQADVSTGNHVDLRLFVDSYVATLNPDRDSSPRYAVLDFNGQDTLQFMVDVFRFAGDAGNLIYISCHLKVTAAEQAPDALNKACSFNKAGNIWSPVEGTRQICSCCETGNCGLVGGQSRRVNPLDRWSGRRFQRDVPPRHGKVSNVYILQTDIQVWLFRWGSIPNPMGTGYIVCGGSETWPIINTCNLSQSIPSAHPCSNKQNVGLERTAKRSSSLLLPTPTPPSLPHTPNAEAEVNLDYLCHGFVQSVPKNLQQWEFHSLLEASSRA